MKKLLLVLPFLFALGLQAQPGGGGMLPNTANRVLTGNGVPSGSTCNNAASVGKVYLRKNAAAANASFYTCDNTASMTYAWELSSGGGGGAGTVTVVGAGSLTSTAFTTGGGSQALQTPCATCTLDASGNAALLSLTLGLGGSVAGYEAFGQGNATTAPTSSVGFQGPAAVTTKFMMTLPAAPVTGLMFSTGASDPTTISFVPVGTGINTFLGTPSSANLAAALTDETGSGAAVFANTPTLVSPVIGAATGTSLALGGSTNACTGGTAGCSQYDQGTVPSGLPANGIQEIAPTSVTSYRNTLPGTVGTSGVDLVTVSGTTATHTFGPIPNTTTSNCSSAATPAVCAAAPAGAVAIPTGATSVTLVVNTTAVTANSEIFLHSDDSLTIAATTCNSTLATLVGGLVITARTAGTSFTITYNGTIATNPLCVAYRLVN